MSGEEKSPGELLLEWRMERGLTRAEAASHLGVNARTIENWETGRRKPRGLAVLTTAALVALLRKAKRKRPRSNRTAAGVARWG